MCGCLVTLPPGPVHAGLNQIRGIKVDALDTAKIDQANPAIGLKEVVARMKIGMKRSQSMKLDEIKFHQPGSNQVPYCLTRFSSQEFANHFALDEGHRED